MMRLQSNAQSWRGMLSDPMSCETEIGCGLTANVGSECGELGTIGSQGGLYCNQMATNGILGEQCAK